MTPRDRILQALRGGSVVGREVGERACVGRGTLYVLLAQLENEGLVLGLTVGTQRHYSLTDRGHALVGGPVYR